MVLNGAMVYHGELSFPKQNNTFLTFLFIYWITSLIEKQARLESVVDFVFSVKMLQTTKITKVLKSEQILKGEMFIIKIPNIPNVGIYIYFYTHTLLFL